MGALKELYEAEGPHAFVRKSLDILRDEKMAQDFLRNFSLRELAEATGFPMTSRRLRAILKDGALYEAVDFTSFPIITTQVISDLMIPAFNDYPKVSSRLCTEIPSNVETVRIPGFTTEDMPEAIAPGQEYPEAEVAEKYVQFDVPDKQGRIISLKEEDIYFDRTNQLRVRAGQIGRGIAAYEEKEFFYTLADQTGFRAYYPAGTATTIYTTATTADKNGMTPRKTKTATNALADYSDIQVADVLLAGQEDERQNPIDIIATHLVCPRALETTAWKVWATFNPGEKGGKGAPFQMAAPVPPYSSAMRRSFEVESTPWLDKISADTWYWGDFKKQWYRVVIFPMGVNARTLRPNDNEWFKRDILFQARARSRKKTAAIDYRYTVQCPGS